MAYQEEITALRKLLDRVEWRAGQLDECRRIEGADAVAFELSTEIRNTLGAVQAVVGVWREDVDRERA